MHGTMQGHQASMAQLQQMQMHLANQQVMLQMQMAAGMNAGIAINRQGEYGVMKNITTGGIQAAPTSVGTDTQRQWDLLNTFPSPPAVNFQQAVIVNPIEQNQNDDDFGEFTSVATSHPVGVVNAPVLSQKNTLNNPQPPNFFPVKNSAPFSQFVSQFPILSPTGYPGVDQSLVNVSPNGLTSSVDNSDAAFSVNHVASNGFSQSATLVSSTPLPIEPLFSAVPNEVDPTSPSLFVSQSSVLPAPNVSVVSHSSAPVSQPSEDDFGEFTSNVNDHSFSKQHHPRNAYQLHQEELHQQKLEAKMMRESQHANFKLHKNVDSFLQDALLGAALDMGVQKSLSEPEKNSQPCKIIHSNPISNTVDRNENCIRKSQLVPLDLFASLGFEDVAAPLEVLAPLPSKQPNVSFVTNNNDDDFADFISAPLPGNLTSDRLQTQTTSISSVIAPNVDSEDDFADFTSAPVSVPDTIRISAVTVEYPIVDVSSAANPEIIKAISSSAVDEEDFADFASAPFVPCRDISFDNAVVQSPAIDPKAFISNPDFFLASLVENSSTATSVLVSPLKQSKSEAIEAVKPFHAAPMQQSINTDDLFKDFISDSVPPPSLLDALVKKPADSEENAQDDAFEACQEETDVECLPKKLVEKFIESVFEIGPYYVVLRYVCSTARITDLLNKQFFVSVCEQLQSQERFVDLLDCLHFFRAFIAWDQLRIAYSKARAEAVDNEDKLDEALDLRQKLKPLEVSWLKMVENAKDLDWLCGLEHDSQIFPVHSALKMCLPVDQQLEFEHIFGSAFCLPLSLSNPSSSILDDLVIQVKSALVLKTNALRFVRNRVGFLKNGNFETIFYINRWCKLASYCENMFTSFYQFCKDAIERSSSCLDAIPEIVKMATPFCSGIRLLLLISLRIRKSKAYFGIRSKNLSMILSRIFKSLNKVLDSIKGANLSWSPLLDLLSVSSIAAYQEAAHPFRCSICLCSAPESKCSEQSTFSEHDELNVLHSKKEANEPSFAALYHFSCANLCAHLGLSIE